MMEILQGILVRLEPGYSLISTVKPENMHAFYVYLQIAAITTTESVRLLAQIPLKSHSHIFSIFRDVSIPIFEPIF
jgi:hypothetical protein